MEKISYAEAREWFWVRTAIWRLPAMISMQLLWMRAGWRFGFLLTGPAYAFQVMELGIGAAAMWGFIFGSWFALRRDRYFVEPI